MTRSLRDDIQQTKPFATLRQEAILNVIRTSATMTDELDDVLRPHGIGATQYNVLRILRGAGSTGLCRNELRDRMLTRMPDVTRLLDRMEESGLVVRARDNDDRRMVSTRITAAGLRLLDQLDAPLGELHQRRMGHLSDDQLSQLIDLLTLARNSG